VADNFESNAGSGGDTFAADDIAGVKYPRSKIIIGADGANDGDVSSANPLPVTGTVAVTNAGLTELAAAINGSSQVDVNIAASAASVAVTNAGLTELAAAINASSQMDVNIAASNATITVSSHDVTNAGTFAVQVDGSALTALQLIDDPVFADDAAFTIGTSKVMVAGGVVDDASTDSADEGDAAAVRLTTDRKVVVNPQPHTTGGLSTARSLDLDETEEDIKTAAGQVYGWNITNFATSTRYVKFYNATAANVTVGTTTPLFTLAIPGNATDDTMLAQALGGMGITFDTAISWAATTGLADNDTGAPGASEVAGTVWYK